ncbi:class F sortase [Streptomyces sp. NPDC001922]|uniref:class F sortase n=1 Tax=Streptomyces sp. NPDC001922 TaxID=3364624 RepID=UPI003680862D
MVNRHYRVLGRLVSCATWAVVLSGLWLWGVRITDGPTVGRPAAGDVAAVGHPAAAPLPASRIPLTAARPLRVAIDSAGVKAPVIERGLDEFGGVDPPPFDSPGVVGWFNGGAQPGAAGVAVLVGHVDTHTEPAVFHRLARVKPGEKVRVLREDRSVAEFTVEAVETFSKARFDAQRVYGARKLDRAELRLITCGGDYDRKRHTYTANVVVSAYLTGTRSGGTTTAARL